MESKETQHENVQEKTRKHWLSHHCGLKNIDTIPMVGDASFRRYFRVYSDQCSFVLMDASLQREQCRPYIAIADALRAMGLQTPEIIAADLTQGFLLITDFGDLTYLRALHLENADQLYKEALSALARLQSCREIKGQVIPSFTDHIMWQEWQCHKDWFLNQLLQISLSRKVEQDLDQCFLKIIEAVKQQPFVFMHRDYHSANLMVLPHHQVGLLDFQDAFIGPLTYDLASLLRDCYIHWPEEAVTRWVYFYFEKMKEQGVLKQVSQEEFLRWFDWMSIERHLKALFTFARKQVRDQQSKYLDSIPRTLHYLIQVTERYTEFTMLHDYLETIIEPTFKQARLSCVL